MRSFFCLFVGVFSPFDARRQKGLTNAKKDGKIKTIKGEVFVPVGFCV